MRLRDSQISALSSFDGVQHEMTKLSEEEDCFATPFDAGDPKSRNSLVFFGPKSVILNLSYQVTVM